MITQQCGFVASAVDPELCYNFGPNGLRCLMTKHVDDLKITGEPGMIDYVVSEFQKVFGDLTIQWNTFVHCGVQHTQDPQTFEVTLDQIRFANTMKTIAHPQVSTGQAEDCCLNCTNCLCHCWVQ